MARCSIAENVSESFHLGYRRDGEALRILSYGYRLPFSHCMVWKQIRDNMEWLEELGYPSHIFNGCIEPRDDRYANDKFSGNRGGQASEICEYATIRHPGICDMHRIVHAFYVIKEYVSIWNDLLELGVVDVSSRVNCDGNPSVAQQPGCRDKEIDLQHAFASGKCHSSTSRIEEGLVGFGFC